GGRFLADDLREVRFLVASPPPGLVAQQVVGLARRDDDQQPPEVVAVAELREPALGGAMTEAGEGAQGHVLLVGGAARRPLESGAGQPNQPTKVALPERLG